MSEIIRHDRPDLAVGSRQGRSPRTLSRLSLTVLLALGPLACSKDEVVGPESKVQVAATVRLASLPDAAARFSPEAIGQIQVEVTGPGITPPIAASFPFPTGADSVAVAVDVPPDSGLVFTFQAVDDVGMAQYQWASAPLDLRGLETYTLHGAGGGDVILDPLPPDAPQLSGELLLAPPRFRLTWTQSTAEDFARYELRGAIHPGVGVADPILFQTTDPAELEAVLVPEDLEARGTDTYLRVYAVDSEGLGAGSGEVELAMPPALTGEALGPYIVRLGWSRCLNSDFYAYRLFTSPDPGVTSEDSLVFQTSSAADTAVSLPVPRSNSTSYYKLYILDAGGADTVGASEEVGVTSAPPIELSYDGGTCEDGVDFAQGLWAPGTEVLVHFTAPGYPVRVARLSCAVIPFTMGSDTVVVRAVIRDRELYGTELYRGPDTLLTLQSMNPAEFMVDLESEDLTMEGDFLAGFEVVSLSSGWVYWAVCVDRETAAPERSFVYTADGGGWELRPLADFFHDYPNSGLGIRAGVGEILP